MQYFFVFFSFTPVCDLQGSQKESRRFPCAWNVMLNHSVPKASSNFRDNVFEPLIKHCSYNNAPLCLFIRPRKLLVGIEPINIAFIFRPRHDGLIYGRWYMKIKTIITKLRTYTKNILLIQHTFYTLNK